MNLKNLIEKEDYGVIIDTNILLRLYNYSPEFSTFALDCLKKISKYIVIPYTVKIEYLNHYRAGFSLMKQRIQDYDKKAIAEIDKFEDIITNQLVFIEKLRFPDVVDLRKDVIDCVDSIRDKFSAYLDEHSFLEIVNEDWLANDLVFDFFSQILLANQVMDCYSPEQIYQICDEGEKRYKNSTPPGYMDAKSKDGVRKYSDLILWKETIQYASTNKRGIIFVTDDLKSDWWDRAESPSIFHPLLIKEFEKKTQQKIQACTAFEFFEGISQNYGIQKSDAIELALSKTANDYADAVYEKVFESICTDLVYSGEEYLDSETAYLGFSDEIQLSEDITDYSFQSVEMIDRDENVITYIFNYEITIDGNSYDYCGRDDDTKEAILSPANLHTFKGIIEVEVIREIESFSDIADDTSFLSAKIRAGNLEQIAFKSYNTDDDSGDAENYCPDCGKPMTFENYGGNGFCTKCAPNH